MELAKLLLAKGAKTANVDCYGLSALKWATERGHQEIIQLLKQAGQQA